MSAGTIVQVAPPTWAIGTQGEYTAAFGGILYLSEPSAEPSNGAFQRSLPAEPSSVGSQAFKMILHQKRVPRKHLGGPQVSQPRGSPGGNPRGWSLLKAVRPSNCGAFQQQKLLRNPPAWPPVGGTAKPSSGATKPSVRSQAFRMILQQKRVPGNAPGKSSGA